MTEKQQARRARIEQAAYDVLGEVGYNSASLLTIAKRASVSNETLYRWYGNKQGLFRSLVEANALEAQTMLKDALGESECALDVLTRLGPVLLALVVGERAIMLNRAAAGDVSDTDTLGQAIAEAGRETIAPLLRDLLIRARREGAIACDDLPEAVEIYFHLLIGDTQIRRVIGVLGALSEAEIERRSHRANGLFLKLYAAKQGDGE